MIHLLKRILRTGIVSEPAPEVGDVHREMDRLQDEVLKILGRALTIREVDAGSCNACELEIHALNNPYYNIEGRGIRFVASPRHADLLLVTGPVARNMQIAVKRAYEAMPAPKLVFAIGSCACGGGIWHDTYSVVGGADKVLPVNYYIPGCPPRPEAIVYGVALALGLVPQQVVMLVATHISL